MAFGNANWDMEGCTWLERNKKMQVHRRWDSEMLTGTWMDAPVWKKIKKMQVHQPWHLGMLTGTWMDAPGWKEIKNSGPSAIGIRNAHWVTDGMHLSRKK